MNEVRRIDLRTIFSFFASVSAGDNVKNVSPFENKWRTPEKRKTVDDTYVNNPVPRLVPLRGSDFTGLGIEVCGGLKDGIHVKKVMPQGPAVNLVHRGDKITSITIDFRHIVQEDAATILSYASPYNVQIELIEGKGTLPKTIHQTLHQQTLTHPLYRSSSQEDLSTIERNARRKLFAGDESSYSTLKMDQQQSTSNQMPTPTKVRTQLPQAHEEHEKKNSLKKLQHFIDLVEEKFQTKSSSHTSQSKGATASTSPTDGKKAMKFGIRVFPPNVNDKEFGKSPSKVQADNENNANMERIDRSEDGSGAGDDHNDGVVIAEMQPSQPQPPTAAKRMKNKIDADATKTKMNGAEFERQTSINSSGIKRDAAGIPQEMPSEMMQAALTARDNRKVLSTNSAERAMKSKGKAPRPPAVENESNAYTEITIGNDANDSNVNRSTDDPWNFTDHFADQKLLNDSKEHIALVSTTTIADNHEHGKRASVFTSTTEIASFSYTSLM